MRAYLIRRCLLIIPTLIGITWITFFITRAVPGGPIEQALLELKFGQTSGAVSNQAALNRQGINAEDLQYLKEFYGFDEPVFTAYLKWLKKVIVFDLGTSYRYQEPVSVLLLERMPVSLYYGFVTTIITYLVSIPLGVLKAVKNHTFIDNTTSVFIFTGYATPGFVLGLLMLVYLGGRLEWFPLRGFTSDDFESLSFFGKITDIIHHSTLPLICYLVGAFATMTVLMKNSLLENLSAEYIKTAYAKGLASKAVLYKHAVRNSLLPLAASFGNNISLVFAGSFLIEVIFNIDGLGLLGYESITQRDYPVVLGTLFLGSLLFLVGNILSDICVAAIDPRIRFR